MLDGRERKTMIPMLSVLCSCSFSGICLSTSVLVRMSGSCVSLKYGIGFFIQTVSVSQTRTSTPAVSRRWTGRNLNLAMRLNDGVFLWGEVSGVWGEVSGNGRASTSCLGGRRGSGLGRTKRTAPAVVAGGETAVEREDGDADAKAGSLFLRREEQ